MEFLKEVLGEALYGQVETAVKAYNEKPENKDKQINIVNNNFFIQFRKLAP